MLEDKDYIYNSGIKIYKRPTMSNRYAPSPPRSPFEDETTNEWREEVDLCVKCGEKTMYKKNVHVDRRMGYVEGAGQLCTSCDKEFTAGGN